ncbi:ABC transporter substrate-binding protein [Ramlibacter sp. G-1-2-2]|uniref:ABC transporter substrate-binding protein n=1 Tax=Ramlibacter agri TaxID=2728837 RepID=A0A848H2E3_9BURK|nr:tripartite tricarboxylate transporter substrate-binding protein [Ramlibacter agri]NML44744.1 ABC transporter substrate-binding protein [Ramlibacter agri]
MTFSRRQLLAAAVALPALARAQGKPAIRVLVGFPPGGATDAIARAVVDRLPALLGQPVIIDNRPGAGGRIAADAVLNAPADGLTYMIAPNATPTFLMLVPPSQVRWNILKDFVPVAGIASYPLGMGVAMNVPAKTAPEFIEWVRRNPGKATVGSPGMGGQNAFLAVQLATTAKIDLPVTPYKGSPPMITDLVGGHLASAISLMDGLMAHHRAGRVRAIGIFTPERSPLMPDIPTFAEQGIPVSSGEAWTAMWARAGTPAAEVQRVQAAVQQVLKMPPVQELMAKSLWVSARFRDGAETAALQRAELEHWEPIIKASGFKAE